MLKIKGVGPKNRFEKVHDSTLNVITVSVKLRYVEFRK